MGAMDARPHLSPKKLSKENDRWLRQWVLRYVASPNSDAIQSTAQLIISDIIAVSRPFAKRRTLVHITTALITVTAIDRM